MEIVWKLVSGASSMWVRWVKANLIKQKDFWLMKEAQGSSWSWRHVLRLRALAQQHVQHLIGNGQNTRFWQDPWYNGGTLAHQFPPSLRYDSTLHFKSSVASIIDDTGWNIPIHILPHIRDIIGLLHSIPVSPNSEDKIIWKPSVNGSFSVKSTYHAIRNHKPTAPWTSLIWFKGRIPKHSFITWLAIRRVLKTRGKLHSWGVSPNANCLLCSHVYESEDHLFAECVFGKEVWIHLLRMLGFNRSIGDWIGEVDWCINTFKGATMVTVLQKLTFCAFVYHIWFTRNSKLHDGIVSTPMQVFHRIVLEIKIKASISQIALQDTDGNRQCMQRWNLDVVFTPRQETLCAWLRPSVGRFMINTDGSLKTGRAGYGAIIRDHSGEPILVGAGSADPSTITMHELQGFEMGLILAKKLGLQQISIATDSMVVTHLVKARNMDPAWRLIHILRRIRVLMNDFVDVNVHHVFRETKRAADLLSNMYPNSNLLEIIPSSFAQDLKNIIFEDRTNCIYRRM